MTHPRLQEILRKYRKGLIEALGDDLDSVLVYGSQARGDAREDQSDIDVLVVMRGPFDYGEAVRKASDPASRLSLEYDLLLSSVFATRKDFEECRLPFYMNVRKEAVPVGT